MQAMGFRQVNTRIWNDEKFSQFSPTDKLVCLYLIAGPQTSRVGCFNFSVGLASDDMALPPETIRPAVRRVCDALSWQWDESQRVIFLGQAWWRYNRAPSGDAATGYRRDFELIPSGELRRLAVRLFNQVVGPKSKIGSTHGDGDSNGDGSGNDDTNEPPQTPPRRAGGLGETSLDSTGGKTSEAPERGPFWKYASDESLWGPDPVDTGNGRRKRQGRAG